MRTCLSRFRVRRAACERACSHFVAGAVLCNLEVQILWQAPLLKPGNADFMAGTAIMCAPLSCAMCHLARVALTCVLSSACSPVCVVQNTCFSFRCAFMCLPYFIALTGVLSHIWAVVLCSHICVSYVCSHICVLLPVCGNCVL